jgi:hypothetical protein
MFKIPRENVNAQFGRVKSEINSVCFLRQDLPDLSDKDHFY